MGVLTVIDGAIAKVILTIGHLVQLGRESPVPTLVGLVLIVVAWKLAEGSAAQEKEDEAEPTSPTRIKEKANLAALEQSLRRLGAPDLPHEEGTTIPTTGFVIGNSDKSSVIRTPMAEGQFLAMHRATFDKALDKSGNHPCGKYFLGKKRLWEARVQIQFLQDNPPDQADMFFGIELEEYVPMNSATKSLMATMVRTLKGVVGNQVYHSPGDNPEQVSGDLERPLFVMPLWAFDQFIVTPPGQKPPDLSDPDIPKMGSKRVSRVRAFRKELEDLKFEKGATYTFCFWGISQWLDKLNWKVKMPITGTQVDFNRFCGRPPVHVVIYTLKDLPNGDKRHLQKRKNYILDLAFWSSKYRPPAERIIELLGEEHFCDTDDLAPVKPVVETNGVTRRKNFQAPGGLFACCASR